MNWIQSAIIMIGVIISPVSFILANDYNRDEIPFDSLLPEALADKNIIEIEFSEYVQMERPIELASFERIFPLPGKYRVVDVKCKLSPKNNSSININTGDTYTGPIKTSIKDGVYYVTAELTFKSKLNNSNVNNDLKPKIKLICEGGKNFPRQRFWHLKDGFKGKDLNIKVLFPNDESSNEIPSELPEESSNSGIS